MKATAAVISCVCGSFLHMCKNIAILLWNNHIKYYIWENLSPKLSAFIMPPSMEQTEPCFIPICSSPKCLYIAQHSHRPLFPTIYSPVWHPYPVLVNFVVKTYRD